MIIIYSRQAIKALERMDAATRDRIKRGISDIPNGDIKPMQGYSDSRQRLKIGKYRVIFRYITSEDNSKELLIIDVGSRGDIYK